MTTVNLSFSESHASVKPSFELAAADHMARPNMRCRWVRIRSSKPAIDRKIKPSAPVSIRHIDGIDMPVQHADGSLNT